ncbi:hypothetical protein [Myxococcus landrumensis]|uniref:Glycerophosphoryl diester phosphodiesterase membrane domain-containing protein n=1 Tax=Myxococcus landrumensis TaxID=2813577 RepID=A0ABX7N9N6_9BACT|nr:hypothetical protein [Myxococcus landrumus]QSQ15133.1 hypothetical protein JY572_03340 [Myxococcus landrumus]
MTPPTSASELRPLALGELIDRAVTFWRGHLKPLFLLSLGYSLVNYIATKGVLELSGWLSPMLFDPKQQAPTPEDLGRIAGSVALWFALFMFLIWSYWLAMVASSRYIVSAQLGTPVSTMDGLRRAFSMLGPVTGAYLLSLLWSAGMSLLLMVPGGILMVAGGITAAMGSSVLATVLLVLGGLALTLGLLAAFLWYFLRFLLLPPVLAMEDMDAWAAFKRSGALLAGRVEPGFLGRGMVRAMILFTVVSLILFSVHLVFSIPSWLVMLPYGNPFDAGTLARTPQLLLVPVEILQVAAQSFFSPVNFVACAFFYVDMRVRREGLDLEQRLGSEPTSTRAA